MKSRAPAACSAPRGSSSEILWLLPVSCSLSGWRGGKWGGVQSEAAESEILEPVTPTVILARDPEQAQKPGSHLPDSWWPVRVRGCSARLCPPGALPSLENLALKLQAQILVERPEQSVLHAESWPGDMRAPEPRMQEES